MDTRTKCYNQAVRNNQRHFLSVVMPCLNEEKTIKYCVNRAKEGIQKTKFQGEIIVCDNGSQDNSVVLAKKEGAKVIQEHERGYGSAYLSGLRAARGNWIVIGDSDGTYDFREIPKLIAPLSQGYDLVVGSRIKGKIRKGAMPLLNRYFGTPCLNLFIKIFFNLHVSDSQSGMRAFTKEAYRRINPQSTGMEFASEMLIRAAQENLKITEVPINYLARISPTKLSRFKDAWRHIRFMLLFTPTYLFLIPGVSLLLIGLLGVFILAKDPLWLFDRTFDFHTMILASMFTIIGYEISMLGIYAKTYSWLAGFSKEESVIKTALHYLKLETGIALGLLISATGLIIGLITFINWAQQDFGQLWAIRPAILSMTLFILGIQIFFSSFFLSILGIRKKESTGRNQRTII